MNRTRSLLFVPSEERRLTKIGQTNADAYIIDLEDSISTEDKDNALQRTIFFLRSCKADNLFVRINKDRYNIELDALRSFNVGIMLPKFESERDYLEAKEELKNHNVIALIETPRALLNADTIAGIQWISALAFGAEDFTDAANIANDVSTLATPKQMLVLAAKANHKKVFDTPCFFIHNDETLNDELHQAVNLGFDGKLAIHPRQVDRINKAFQLNDPKYIKHVIEVYESFGNVVCDIDGRVYEKLHIERLKKTLIDLD